VLLVLDIYEEIAKSVVTGMLENTVVDPQMVDIYFVDDMFTASQQYACCDFQIDLFNSAPEQLIYKARALNGQYLLPQTISGRHTILISEKQREGFLFASTVAHESQHIIDIFTYCQRYCRGDYGVFCNSLYYEYVLLWSEFRAHLTGHVVFVTYLHEQLLKESRKSIKRHTRRFEVPEHKKMVARYLAEREDVFGAIQSLIRLFGKFAAWQCLYGFGDELIPQTGQKLYEFLRNSETDDNWDVVELKSLTDKFFKHIAARSNHPQNNTFVN